MAKGQQYIRACIFCYFTLSFISFLGIKVGYLLGFTDNSGVMVISFSCFMQEVRKPVEAFLIFFYFYGNLLSFVGISYQFFVGQTC